MRLDPKSKLGMFVNHVFPGVVRPMRVLVNEIVGFLFAVIAVSFVPGLLKSYRALKTPQGNPGGTALGAGLVALMFYFAISSFLRARRISRSS
ncbi:MAG: hypothetical protein ABI824_06010 [Acidobacteriota bacterium]